MVMKNDKERSSASIFAMHKALTKRVPPLVNIWELQLGEISTKEEKNRDRQDHVRVKC